MKQKLATAWTLICRWLSEAGSAYSCYQGEDRQDTDCQKKMAPRRFYDARR